MCSLLYFQSSMFMSGLMATVLKKWQSTNAGMQSHVLKAVAAFGGSLSNETLRLAPLKVNSLNSL